MVEEGREKETGKTERKKERGNESERNLVREIPTAPFSWLQ